MASRSFQTYKKQAEKWYEFVRDRKLGEHLDDVPDDIRHLVVIDFLRHLSKDLRWTPRRMTAIMSALRFIFRVNTTSTACLDHPRVLLAMQASKRTMLAREANKVMISRKRDPMTIDMVKWLRSTWWLGKNEVNKLAYLGTALGFNFMCRISELVKGRGDHYLRREDVSFVKEAGRLVGADLTIRSSKTDVKGKGRFLYLGRRTPLESELLDDLHSWVCRSKVGDEDALLSTGTRVLMRSDVARAIKAAATAHRLDARKFSPHSLRVGGATTMERAGVSQLEIQRVGGWAAVGGTVVRSYGRSTRLDKGALAVNDPTAVLQAKHVFKAKGQSTA